ncbi:MAG: sensor histidine kinase, partial [Candidatus Binatia bacterium]
MVDISRVKRLESELRQRVDELAETDRRKDDFLASMSHELRTPLTAVLGWAQRLRNKSFEGVSLERALEIIERNAKVQAQIINDLLDLSRITVGKFSLDIRSSDLRSIVSAAVETVQPAADAKSITIESSLGNSLGPYQCDPDRLQQVVWNLLSNAVKFSDNGKKVQVRLERVNSEARIKVIDMGSGIDPQFLPHVFDRFRQADSSTARRYGGLGLGLALARHLVELHGGTIEARSSGKGLGACFTVRLPLC